MTVSRNLSPVPSASGPLRRAATSTTIRGHLSQSSIRFETSAVIEMTNAAAATQSEIRTTRQCGTSGGGPSFPKRPISGNLD